MNDTPTKYFFRQRNKNRIFDAVVAALENANIPRSELARRLGIPRSQISRQLSGPANWTCDTISDLLFAIDAEMEYRVARWADYGRPNQRHPASMPAVTREAPPAEDTYTTSATVTHSSSLVTATSTETEGAPTRVTVRHASI